MSSKWFAALKPGDEVAVVTNYGQNVATAKVKKRTPQSDWVVLEDGRRFRPDQYNTQEIIQLDAKIPYSDRARLLPIEDAKVMAERIRLAQQLEGYTLFWRSQPLEKLKSVCAIVFGAEEARS